MSPNLSGQGAEMAAISLELRSYYDFFDKLRQVERLVIVRSGLIYAYGDIHSIGKVIRQKIEELTASNSTVSNHDCCKILDRLIDIRMKICRQSQGIEDELVRKGTSIEAYLHWGGVLDHLISLKLDNLIALASEEHIVDLLEWLADMGKRWPDSDLTTIISKKINLLTAKDWASDMPDNASLASSEHMITPEGSENEDPVRESKDKVVIDGPNLDHGRLEKLQHDLYRAESDIGRLNRELSEAKRINASLEMDKMELQNTFDSVTFEKQRTAEKLADTQDSLTEIAEQRDNLQGLLNDANIDNATLSRELAHTKDNYRSLKSLSKEFGNSLLTTRSDKDAVSKKITELREMNVFRDSELPSLIGLPSPLPLRQDLQTIEAAKSAKEATAKPGATFHKAVVVRLPNGTPKQHSAPVPSSCDGWTGDLDSTKFEIHHDHGVRIPTEVASAPKRLSTFQDLEHKRPYKCPFKEDMWDPEAESDYDCDCSTICECDRPRKSESDCGCGTVCKGHRSKEYSFGAFRGWKSRHMQQKKEMAEKNDLDRNTTSTYLAAAEPAEEDTYSNIDGGRRGSSVAESVGKHESHVADLSVKKLHPWTFGGPSITPGDLVLPETPKFTGRKNSDASDCDDDSGCF